MKKVFQNSLVKDEVEVSFFGGEPTLRSLEISQLMESLSKKYNNIEYTITTNGTLLKPNLIESFKNHNVTVSVSIDGKKNIHDTYRKFHNGIGSYDIISSNYKLLKKSGIKCGIVSVVKDPEIFIETFDFFHNEFNERSIHLKPMIFNGTSDEDEMKLYYDTLVVKQLELLSWFINIYQNTKVKFKESYTFNILHMILMSQIDLHKTCDMGTTLWCK